MHIHSRIGRAKPLPRCAGRGEARVVVQSIGNSGVGLLSNLCRMLPVPEPDLTALMFQAPSALLTGLDRSTADTIAGSLRELGLDCAVFDGDTAIEEGVGDHEVALNVRDFTRMRTIVREVMCVLGIDERSARQLVCTVPAVLLAGVSSATVHALRARFAALGAGIDASHPDTARFDLYLGYCTPVLRARALARLQAVAGDVGHIDATTGVLCNIDAASADRACREVRLLAVPLRVVNRDFARYAVTLQHSQDTPELRRCLLQQVGLSEGLIAQVVRNLPMVVQHGLRYAETATMLAALQTAGACASAEPIAFQRFSLSLEPVRDPAPLLPVLCELSALSESDALDVLRSAVPRLPGPFTTAHARWLAHDLRRAGAGVQLESCGA